MRYTMWPRTDFMIGDFSLIRAYQIESSRVLNIKKTQSVAKTEPTKYTDRLMQIQVVISHGGASVEAYHPSGMESSMNTT